MKTAKTLLEVARKVSSGAAMILLLASSSILTGCNKENTDWQKRNADDDLQGRIWKGGGWIGADFCCELAFRAGYEANGKGPDQGFRVCRDSK